MLIDLGLLKGCAVSAIRPEAVCAVPRNVDPSLDRIDRLSRRERMLVMVTILTVIAGLWQLFVMGPHLWG